MFWSPLICIISHNSTIKTTYWWSKHSIIMSFLRQMYVLLVFWVWLLTNNFNFCPKASKIWRMCKNLQASFCRIVSTDEKLLKRGLQAFILPSKRCKSWQKFQERDGVPMRFGTNRKLLIVSLFPSRTYTMGWSHFWSCIEFSLFCFYQRRHIATGS